MYIYSVTCHVANSIAEEWKSFFLEKHLQDVVNTGCFTSFEFRKNTSKSEDNTTSFTSEYRFDSMQNFDLYNEKFGATLKKEVNELYGGQYNCHRTIYEIVS